MVLNNMRVARLVSGILLDFEVLKSGDPTHEYLLYNRYLGTLIENIRYCQHHPESFKKLECFIDQLGRFN